MIEIIKEFGRIVKVTFWEFLEDDCMSMAAALSFYTMFSLPPLLLIVVTSVSTFFPYSREQVSSEVIQKINFMVGEKTGDQILVMLEKAGQAGTNTATKIFGIGMLIFAATSVLAQLQYSLNITWQVEPDPEQGGVRHFILKRILSLAMLVAIAFLFLVSLIVSTALEAFHQAIQSMFEGSFASFLIRSINFFLSFSVITFLFGAIYKVLPDAKITWRDIWMGSIVSALLFVTGKFAISYYLVHSNIGSAYGAANALAVILIWVYYASLIVFAGAEFTQVWARRHGTGLHPARGAVHSVTRHEQFRKGEVLPPESKERREGKIFEEGDEEEDEEET